MLRASLSALQMYVVIIISSSSSSTKNTKISMMIKMLVMVYS